MSWSSRRRSLFLFSFILIVVLVVGIIFLVVIHQPPTCTDGTQNGSENGVDCGGACPLVCPFEAIPPIIEWSRVFEIANNVYSAVAFIENPNASFEAPETPYVFRLRDENNILVYERKGYITIPAKKKFPIFETGIQTGARIPKRVEFTFLADPVWHKGQSYDLPLTVGERLLENASTSPRLSVKITNTSLDTLPALTVDALLYAEDGNVVHISRTVIDRMRGNEEQTLFFTWPKPFTVPVVRIDIIPILRDQ